MKNLKVSFLLYLIFTILSSCNSDQIKEPVQPVVQEKMSSNLSALIDDTGILNLQLSNASWEEVHDNYIQTVSSYGSHPKLLTYKQHVVLYQIEKTSMLNNLTPKKIEILKTYLKDLEVSHYGYPKVNYLLLNALKSFLEKDDLKYFAKLSYEKGKKEKQKRRNKINNMLNSNETEEVKQSYQKSFQENYLKFLPKLKEFLVEE